MSRFATPLQSFQSSIENAAGAIMVPAIIYGISRVTMQAAAQIHWTLGVLAALPFITLIAALLFGLTDDVFRRFPGRVVLSLFATVALTAASVCASASFALWEAGHASYLSSAPLAAGRFADYFIWVFIDMVPALEIWATLDVEAPVQPSGLAAGIPVLVFRVLVVLPLIGYFRKWLRVRKQQRSAEGSSRHAA